MVFHGGGEIRHMHVALRSRFMSPATSNDPGGGTPQRRRAHAKEPDVSPIPRARAPASVQVFVPYAATSDGIVSPYYDTPEFRADVASWLAPRGWSWEWVAVTADRVERLAREASAAGALVFNLCDGDEINGYPGLSVVRALEAEGVPFTGARSHFYDISTSKLAMKRRFEEAGVATAPYRVVESADDVARAAEALGLPLFVKPDISFGAAGITVRSRAISVPDAVAAVDELREGLMHGCHFERGRIFVEPYLAGREFTALVVRDRRAGGGVHVVTPCERVFDPAIPIAERFLTFERICGEYERDRPLAPGSAFYGYALAPKDLRAKLADLARRAFLAVAGTGYARVDMRLDAHGAPFVLEVNANCSLSSDDTSSVGSILALARIPMVELIGRILRDGWRRESPAGKELVAS